ncbi:MAG: nucleotidyltransferase family protein [Phycisphaerae bacterium]
MPVKPKRSLAIQRRPEISLRQIKHLLRKHLPEFRQKYGVQSLGIFGSYIRKEQKPRSDLDILVDFDRDISLIQFVNLELELSDLLGVKVDLVDRETLKPEIGKNILREVVGL